MNVCNKRVIESLIKAGAFAEFGHPRKGMLLVHEQAIDAVIDVKRNEAMGQDSLFAMLGPGPAQEAAFDVPIPAGEWEKATLLAFEREMLGLYVSDHPLLGIGHVLAAAADCSVAQLAAAEEDAGPAAGNGRDGQVVTIGGILSGVTRKVTKQGSMWAQATLEDLDGAIEVLFFPAAYQQYMSVIIEDAIVVVKGRVDRREDAPKLIGMEVSAPQLTAADAGPLVVSVAESRCVGPVVERLREVLRTHPGTTQVHLRLVSGQRAKVMQLDDKLRVRLSPALLADLKQLLGAGCTG